ASSARLVVYDISGREVNRREVGDLGMGRHVVTLSPRRELAPGVYLVHLIHGDRSLVARAVLVR
ncbi:MAG TPA: T9SS type A sorting domain-containing protein, partial [Candidatus Eisenbacteria bacterium]|nr:T9SS type A sorting domain-containing protein [Candidatus Eisenbacteria bacterium]